MPSLTAEGLFRELAAKRVRPVYYFSGEEAYRKQLAVSLLKELLNPDDFNFYSADADRISAGELVSTALTAPVFSSSRLIILNRAEKLKADARKALADYALNPLDTTCLVIVADEKKSAKENPLSEACLAKGVKVIFYSLKDDEARDWVMEHARHGGVNFAPDAARLLVDAVGTDLHALEREVTKLGIYVAGGKDNTITAAAVLESLGYSREENPFELSRAILSRDTARSAQLIDRLVSGGEEPLFLLSLVAGTVLKVIIVKRLTAAGASADVLFSAAGLNRYYERDFVRLAEAWPDEGALVKILGDILDGEAALKTSALSMGEAAVLLKSLALKLSPRPARK